MGTSGLTGRPKSRSKWDTPTFLRNIQIRAKGPETVTAWDSMYWKTGPKANVSAPADNAAIK